MDIGSKTIGNKNCNYLSFWILACAVERKVSSEAGTIYTADETFLLTEHARFQEKR